MFFLHLFQVPTLCAHSDTELSCISSVTTDKNLAIDKNPVKKDDQQERDHVVKESEDINTAEQYLQQQHQQLAQLQQQVVLIFSTINSLITFLQVKTLLQNHHFSNPTATQKAVYTTEASTNTGQSLLSLNSCTTTVSQDGPSLPSLQTLEQSTLTSAASSFLDIPSPDHTHYNRESSPELGASASCYQDHSHHSVSTVNNTSQWKDNSQLYLRLKVSLVIKFEN